MRPALVLAVLATGCVGEVGPDPHPVDPDPVPMQVALSSAPALAPEGPCVALSAGERVLDVSPEGDAWLASDAGLRVLSRDGSSWALPYPPAAPPSYLVAHGARDATWIAEGRVERTVPGGLRRVHVSADAGTPRFLCGDPEASGPFFVATELGLHGREGGQLWRFAIDGDALAPSFPFALASGACTHASGELWFADDDGTWRLDVAAASPVLRAVEALPAGLEIARDGTLAAVAGPETLFVVEGRTPFEIAFDAGVARGASVGDGRVWAWLGDVIARRERDGSWSRIDRAADAVHADATGGAWAVDGAELCRLETDPVLSITGLAPDERVTSSRALVVTASAPAEAARVSIDDAVVFEATSSGTRFDAGELAMGAPGWHQLAVVARIDGREVTRAIAYEVVDTAPLSFERDVEPLVTEHCTSCHRESTTTGARLDSYDAFRARAPSALARLVRREMPPSPLGPAPAEMVRTVERWIEGGMMP